MANLKLSMFSGDGIGFLSSLALFPTTGSLVELSWRSLAVFFVSRGIWGSLTSATSTKHFVVELAA